MTLAEFFTDASKLFNIDQLRSQQPLQRGRVGCSANINNPRRALSNCSCEPVATLSAKINGTLLPSPFGTSIVFDDENGVQSEDFASDFFTYPQEIPDFLDQFLLSSSIPSPTFSTSSFSSSSSDVPSPASPSDDLSHELEIIPPSLLPMTNIATPTIAPSSLKRSFHSISVDDHEDETEASSSSPNASKRRRTPAQRCPTSVSTHNEPPHTQYLVRQGHRLLLSIPRRWEGEQVRLVELRLDSCTLGAECPAKPFNGPRGKRGLKGPDDVLKTGTASTHFRCQASKSRRLGTWGIPFDTPEDTKTGVCVVQICGPPDGSPGCGCYKMTVVYDRMDAQIPGTPTVWTREEREVNFHVISTDHRKDQLRYNCFSLLA